MNVSQFIFFDTTSTSDVSNPFGNTGYGSALTLQVDDFDTGAEINLDVLGSVDMQSDSYYPLKVVSLDDFKTYKTITKKGIYLVIIAGVSFIKIKSNAPVGTFKAYAVSVS